MSGWVFDVPVPSLSGDVEIEKWAVNWPNRKTARRRLRQVVHAKTNRYRYAIRGGVQKPGSYFAKLGIPKGKVRPLTP